MRLVNVIYLLIITAPLLSCSQSPLSNYFSSREPLIFIVQNSIDNKTIKSRYIDYKSQTYGNNDKDKKEYHKVISSFANNNGEDLGNLG